MRFILAQKILIQIMKMQTDVKQAILRKHKSKNSINVAL